MPGRSWGFWTKEKLDLLRRYLDKFTTASKSMPEILYFDLFAGQAKNYDRITGDPISGSSRIALEVSDPKFSRLRFFELEPHAAKLEVRLRADFSGRDLKVHPGDCNSKISDALAEVAAVNWAPTFAFIDPNGPDVHWATLEALARFKKPGTTKVEMWVLFPHSMFTRLLPISGEVRPEDARRLTLMFGTEEWRFIYETRLNGSITPARAREEYVNLMRWRFEQALGYQWTHALELVSERNQPLYDMVFATDHEAGNRIMANLYNSAAAELPEMRQAALEQRKRIEEDARGVMRLFEEEPAGEAGRAAQKLYKHLPPSQPFWIPEDTSPSES